MQLSTRRRWFQFSTLGLLALMVLVALICAFVIVPARTQHDAVQRILDRGGTVAYDFEQGGRPLPVVELQPPGPAWLRAIVGDDYFQTVHSVHFYVSENRDDVADVVRAAVAFPALESLQLRCPGINDEDMRAIGTLTSLKGLYVKSDNSPNSAPLITSIGVSYLADLRGLEILEIDGSFSDDALAALSGLSELRWLRIEAPITDSGMVHLQSLEKIETLWAGGPNYDLEDTLDMDFDDNLFSDVLDFYCANLDIDRDPSCQPFLKSHEETKITGQFRGTLRDVIDQTLEPYGLGFRITNRRFVLTSRAEAIAARAGITDLRKRLRNLTNVRVAW